MATDLRTKAIVLRRTNYGESDRILNLLTPEGKIAVLAKGVRKEKSRLAGGIEPFLLSDVVIHRSRSQGLGILTSARMLRSYHGILVDLERLELASEMMKKIERASEQIDSPEYFSLLNQALGGLNRSFEQDVVLAWFLLNFTRIGGEEINLYRDANGQVLEPTLFYTWDVAEKAMRMNVRGDLGADEIKIIRLMLNSPLAFIAKIDRIERLIMPILTMAKNLVN